MAHAGPSAVDESIRQRVDDETSALHVDALSREQKERMLASHFGISAGLLVPVFGSWRLDVLVFGKITPAAVVADWFAGGLLPAGLALTAWLAGDRLSESARLALLVTSLALYAAARVGVLIVGNDHVSVYNRFMRSKLGLDVPATAAP